MAIRPILRETLDQVLTEAEDPNAVLRRMEQENPIAAFYLNTLLKNIGSPVNHGAAVLAAERERGAALMAATTIYKLFEVELAHD